MLSDRIVYRDVVRGGQGVAVIPMDFVGTDSIGVFRSIFRRPGKNIAGSSFLESRANFRGK